MKKAWVLLLLAMAAAVACYEPVNLAPEKDPGVVSVYCVLNPTDTQYLELRYLSRVGEGVFRGIDDAEVIFSEYSEGKDGGRYTLARSKSFQPLGDGRWQLVLPPRSGEESNIRPGNRCELRVILRSGDTLSAFTTMPVLDAVEKIESSYIVGDADADTVWYDYPPWWRSQYVWGKDGRKPAFRLHPFQGAVWVSKAGWSTENQRWFLEEELATNREDLTDGFNVTGHRFVRSDDPMALDTYPEVKGQPLHNRYIRFISGASADSLLFSGDFKGPHYGNTGDIICLMIMDKQQYISICDEYGIPYKSDFLDTDLVGKLRFKIVSEEYDHYLKDVMSYHLLHEESTDIAAIYDNTNVYTNIEGGTGVFGAAVEITHYWSCGTWVWE